MPAKSGVPLSGSVRIRIPAEAALDIQKVQTIVGGGRGAARV
jgi:hypothetical protein